VTVPTAPLDCLGAAAPLLVGEAAPDAAGVLAVLGGAAAAELAPGGVNGTVTPRPGSLEFGTLAANCVKVLLPVVGAFMAPYMPLWQCGGRPQKNQIGLLVWVISNE